MTTNRQTSRHRRSVATSKLAVGSLALSLLAASCGSSTTETTTENGSTSNTGVVTASGTEETEEAKVEAETEESPAVNDVEETPAEDAAAEEDSAAEDTAPQTAAVDIAGDALVAMPNGTAVTDATTDPAAGALAPTLTGTNFAGDELKIEDDGRPKAIYFLAHWCPHCQAEVPVIAELLAAGQLPDGLDLYAISTAVDETRDNFPPEPWLADLEVTVIRDDETSSSLSAFGGTSFPYVVYLDADHQVVARSSGNLDEDAIVELWTTAIG